MAARRWRCNLLAMSRRCQVGVPCKRLLETVTVKCGHCSNLSFLTIRPMPQSQYPDLQLGFQSQGFSNDYKRGHSSSTSSQNVTSNAPNVVKPPEKKHRLPSAYNRFMKDEIQQIKAINPEIPHREAFSMAAKNDKDADFSVKIEEGFGPSGLGIISVSDPCSSKIISI